MAIKRMDNVLIVVEDIDAAIGFFEALGMELEGRTTVSGDWVDKCVGLKDVRSEIAMMRTPDGVHKVELSRFLSPDPVRATPHPAPSNTLGLRRIMFQVDDLDATLDALRPHGATLLDDIVTYETYFRLCFIRGPEGIIIGLAQQLT